MNKIDIVFDGPPSHESGRFVEVEDMTGKSINAGEWIDRGNGLWALRIDLCAKCAELETERDRMAELVKAVHTDSIKRADTGGVQIYISNGTWIDIKKVAGEESK